MGSRAKKSMWLGVAAMAIVVGCSDDSTLEPPAADVVLRVVVDGEVTADWTLADLEDQLAFTEVTIDGDVQSGPLLQDVLAASGVEGWETAQVVGLGEGRAFAVGLDITAADVNDGWIFDVTRQGTLKLATPDRPRQEWVRDAGEIRIP